MSLGDAAKLYGLTTAGLGLLLKLTEEEQEDEIDSTDSKLDLARAYIEMGDTDGARTLLAEIVNIGTPAQQIEAKELLLRVDTKSD